MKSPHHFNQCALNDKRSDAGLTAMESVCSSDLPPSAGTEGKPSDSTYERAFPVLGA
jgi:hypothetical protein